MEQWGHEGQRIFPPYELTSLLEVVPQTQTNKHPGAQRVTNSRAIVNKLSHKQVNLSVQSHNSKMQILLP
jgi:hypothetical protein